MTYGPSPKVSALAFVIMAVLIVFFIWQNDQRIFADDGRLNIELKSSTLHLSWRGPVEVPMARHFTEAFYEYADQSDKVVINLSSPGGAISEGRVVIDLISNMKRTHIVETHVGRFQDCLSMCVPIYLQGGERRAASSSRWMFHEPRAVNIYTGEEERAPAFERRIESKKFFDRYFVDSPMKPEWRDQLAKDWVGKDVWKTGKELIDEDAGIILTLY